MTFDRVAEIWSGLVAGRVPHRHAFVVATQGDAMLVNGIDVEAPFRPDVVGRGKTIGWAYIDCPNGDRMVAKIKATAGEDEVTKVLTRLADIGMQ